MPSAVEEPTTAIEYVINTLKVLVAISPLLVLGYILSSAFESEEAETKKRSKKSDFQLEGHGE
eukprot:CAMPEP_0194026838 /NCGR_PEP_ID=MMETSP0009_2-20130614/1096_1 /TAXON_ID=210454 /ORGANISM="Grammatophora oceanica, Strain CCMP 410" /LENGTH=62 /DNA_ID=CAMNT_0038665707 /DNA_START=93 /DNA_END=281 /DNA_ORIENTATION=+